MKNEIFRLVFVLFLMVPSMTVGTAPKTSSEELCDIGFSKHMVERFKLIAMAVEEFIGLYGVLSVKGPEVFDAVLKDANVTKIQTTDMENYLQEFRDYNKEAEIVRKHEEKGETFDLFKEFSKIIGIFHHEKLNELSPAALAVHNSLKENGLESVNDAIVRHFEGFMKKFTIEVERYFASLSDQEKLDEEKFHKWFENLKSESDIMVKIELFDKIVDDEDDGVNERD